MDTYLIQSMPVSNTLATWCEEPTYWEKKTTNKNLVLGKTKGRRQPRMRWLDGLTDSVGMSLHKLWKMVKDREAWHAVVHGVTKSQTWLSDWTTMSMRKKDVVLVILDPLHCGSVNIPGSGSGASGSWCWRCWAWWEWAVTRPLHRALLWPLETIWLIRSTLYTATDLMIMGVSVPPPKQ